MKNILIKVEEEYNALKSASEQERVLNDPILLCLLKNVEKEMEYIFCYAPKTEDKDGYIHIEVSNVEGYMRSNPFLSIVYRAIRSDEVIETGNWDYNKDPRINIFSAFQSSINSIYKTFIPRYNIGDDVLKIVCKKR